MSNEELKKFINTQLRDVNDNEFLEYISKLILIEKCDRASD